MGAHPQRTLRRASEALESQAFASIQHQACMCSLDCTVM